VETGKYNDKDDRLVKNAEEQLPSTKNFIFRFGVMIFSAALVASYSLISFNLLVALATPADQKIISRHGVPVGLSGVLIYSMFIILIATPMIRYIRRVRAGAELDEQYVFSIQDKALNLGYKMAVLASMFYMLVNPISFYAGIRGLGWDAKDLMWYGLVGSFICSLIMIPIGMNFGSWVVRPIVNHTAYLMRETPARRAGWKLSLNFKLLITFMPIMAALLLYASTIGYSQTKTIFNNMKAMELTYLDHAERMELVDEVKHRTDPGIRSSKYFEKHVSKLRVSYIVFIVVGIGISLIFTFLASSETTHPLRVLTKASELIEEGKLDESVRLVTTDEMADLAAVFNQMMGTINMHMKSMESIVEKLQDGIIQIDDTVSTVASVSAAQSTGATEQATIAEQASTVSGEIVATAKSIAERAKSVDEVASSTLTACQDGEVKLNQARTEFQGIAQQTEDISEKMKNLDEKFREIYKIMELIESIADQTDLLALNAALEAVGAGKHGKRFMVVAQSTRRLANKSSEAAQEIRNLVETIQKSTVEAKSVAEEGKEKVVTGGKAIEKVTEAFKSISSFASSTSSAVNEISVTTVQQTTGSEQLADAINEILEVAKKVEGSAKGIETTIAGLSNFAETLRASTQK